MTVRVDAQALETFARDLLAGMGAGSGTAQQVAESLVGSDLVGHTSHGVIRLPWYDEMVEADRLDPTATPAVESEDGATAAVDGRMAFGQVVGRTAVEVGVARAEEGGVAAVGVRNATHLGRIGEWAERAAGADLLFAAFVNTEGGSQTVAPPGSVDRRMAPNPLAFGVPTYDALEFPLVLDVATSQVANGKVRELVGTGVPLPEAWTVDADGGAVTDPRAFLDGAGAMLPLGGRATGHKGFGLAVVAELFAALVGGGLVAGQREREWANNAAAFLLIDPERFVTRAEAAERVRALADHLRSAEPAPGLDVGASAKGDVALLPGEAEHRTAARRRDEGIPLTSETADSLLALAEDVGAGDAVPPALH